MSEQQPLYWMNLTERDAPAEQSQQEFVEKPDPDSVTTRRTFLKAAGFSFTGLMAGGCGSPAVTAIPYLQQPEGITPGRPYQYASTCGACPARCGLLVTNRDGRPLKIEGNPDHPLSGGATCAAGQASILGLYDSLRLSHPMRRGERSTWADIDADIVAALDQVRQQGGAVRILSGTNPSPTAAAVIAEFLTAFTNARHVTYDPISMTAVLDAHAATHGQRAIPRYHFDRADVIVGIDADFLGTWISPVEFTRANATRRRPDQAPAAGEPAMSYHVQIESRLSLTGANADRRIRVAPGEIGLLLTHLAAKTAGRAGAAFEANGLAPSAAEPALEEIADRLWNARGRSLVISGSQNVRDQLLCNFINEQLRSYGATMDLARPSYQGQGNDHDLDTLRGELRRGEVAALIITGANPVYDLPDSATLADDLRRVRLLISTAERVDETAGLAHYICPDHHYLESWGDAEPVAGLVSLMQPTIRPLGDTRSFIESLAAWSGRPQPALDLIKGHWQRAIHPRAGAPDPFLTFWNRTLERGAAEIAPRPADSRAFQATAVQPILRGDQAPAGGLALVLYPKVGMLDGRHGHNAWLHELPDPVSKVTWDNYACVSPAEARRLGVIDGDVVRVAASDPGGPSIELPAFIQPGQSDGVVAIALGYGRAGTERFGNVGPAWLFARPRTGLVGVNASMFVTSTDGTRRLSGRPVTLAKTGATHILASTQEHHSLAVPPFTASAPSPPPRPIVQDITLEELRRPAESSEPVEHHADLWPADHVYEGHRWGMAIDLNSCTGCSACVIACQAENNVPVVGQDEVRRHREMHWIRIDRYYSGGDEDVTVAHQPMLCQHCEHAPCETVCPVLATTHSEEGLNEQAYNRCVGTRYCANNCPYKVRRFNWFDYPHDDQLRNLSLNPNVTVRSRGVMEKCTLCVHRIQEGKIEAQRTGEPLRDNAIKTACQQVCPAEAIVFGDLNDPKSRVAQLAGNRRAFRVLEELNTRPAIRYLKIVRHG